MPGKALLELKQTRPFPSLADEAFLNIQLSAEAHLRAVAETLKPHGLSPAQYNVLRILRGAGADGLPSGEIGHRMVNRDPDVTRLLDRLESRNLIRRTRGTRDRRVVSVQVTGEALDLLATADQPVADAIHSLFQGFSDQMLVSLISYLEETRKHDSQETFR